MKFLILFLALLSVVPSHASTYDDAVLSDNPTLYLPLSAHSAAIKEKDRSVYQHSASYLPRRPFFQKTLMPNGDRATVFDGLSQYVEIPSSKHLSVKKNRGLTLEAWIRPDTLQFTKDESDGYVHWAGKGETGEHEYVLRMYSLQNSASRPNRISAYVFNPDGGLGSGSYFQDLVVVGQWIHVAMVVDMRRLPGEPESGTVSIFKNGVLRKKTPLSQFDVVPEAGDAPLRIGTRDFRSFFRGAIGKFAIYNYPLSVSQLKSHFQKMH